MHKLLEQIRRNNMSDNPQAMLDEIDNLIRQQDTMRQMVDTTQQQTLKFQVCYSSFVYLVLFLNIGFRPTLVGSTNAWKPSNCSTSVWSTSPLPSSTLSSRGLSNRYLSSFLIFIVDFPIFRSFPHCSFNQIEEKERHVLTLEEDLPDEKFEISAIMTDLVTLKAKIEEQIQSGDDCEALTTFSILFCVITFSFLLLHSTFSAPLLRVLT